MKRRSLEDWRTLVQQQVESSLSVAEFCKQQQLAQSYFYKRKSDLRKRTDEQPSAKFIKLIKPNVNVAAIQSTSIRIQYQQVQLSLPVSISPR